jgi:hypothetical protein
VALAGLPLLAKILIGLVAPPIVTIVCWLIGPRLVGARRERTRERNRVEFWLMLIAAYLVFSLALGGSHFFAGNWKHAVALAAVGRTEKMNLTSSGVSRCSNESFDGHDLFGRLGHGGEFYQ